MRTTGTGSSGEVRGIASLRDVEAIEARGTPSLPPSTYEALRRGAEVDPDAPALSFFPTVDRQRHPETWSYRALVARITQTANFFHRLDATKDTIIMGRDYLSARAHPRSHRAAPELPRSAGSLRPSAP